jgi:hypothetical protein
MTAPTIWLRTLFGIFCLALALLLGTIATTYEYILINVLGVIALYVVVATSTTAETKRKPWRIPPALICLVPGGVVCLLGASNMGFILIVAATGIAILGIAADEVTHSHPSHSPDEPRQTTPVASTTGRVLAKNLLLVLLGSSAVGIALANPSPIHASLAVLVIVSFMLVAFTELAQSPQTATATSDLVTIVKGTKAQRREARRLFSGGPDWDAGLPALDVPPTSSGVAWGRIIPRYMEGETSTGEQDTAIVT